MSSEDVENFERTLELGKQLAQDLSDGDILGRWMAHHIGDLIVKAENATGRQALELGRETADTIIRLWAHRSNAPLRSRPTEALEPVLKTLVRLEQDKPWRFYEMFPTGEEPDDDANRTTLLRFALELGETVRDVVRHIIVVAAKQAVDKESKWLTLAEHLAEDDQRNLLCMIRRMERRMRAENAEVAFVDDVNEHARAIEALRKAEMRLTEVRHVLEEHFTTTTGKAIEGHTP